MVQAGVRGMPARHAFRDQFRAFWLITDQQNAEILARVFPEVFRNELRGEAVKIPQGVRS